MRDVKVSILMSVYNGGKFLGDAIESMLSQGFKDFEFIIINDGSIDDSLKIINSYHDERIRLVDNGGNIGLVNSLNKGLELAKGEYIVRMDCDDISCSNRLSSQVKFMNKHKMVGASGSYYDLMFRGKHAVADFPLNNEEISCYLIFNSPMAHPSVIIRRQTILERKLSYRSEFVHAEDYDLWSRISENAELSNIPEVLLNYRVHEGQITENPNLVVAKRLSLDKIRLRHLKRIDMNPDDRELFIHNMVSDGRRPASDQELAEAEAWLKKIVMSNRSSRILSQPYLEKIITERWLRMCFNYYGAKKGLLFFMRSGLYKIVKLPMKQKLELLKNIYYSYKRKKIKLG